jgi:hypothetical protein
VATEAGRAQILEMVDSLGELFAGRVAQFRNVSVDKVKSDFGQGKMLIARQAVAAGMADEISSFEPLVARLAATASPRAYISVKETTMENPTDSPPAPAPAPVAMPAPAAAAAPAIPAVPAMTERQRILAIQSSEEGKGREILANLLAFEFDFSVEDCRRIMAAAPPGAKGNPLEAAMRQVPNPRIGPGTGEDNNSPQAEAQRILAFVPKERRVRAANE